ncbi:MAG: class I tRNA ligase family protein [Thermoplasmata archaeon]|nr:class I tRNA ligase family protein [Thermoplasmata archaeon]
MQQLAARYNPAAVEAEVLAFWASRSLPGRFATLGAPSAPRSLQLLGTVDPGDPELTVLWRTVAADVDARFLALSGRRTEGLLLRRDTGSQPGRPARFPGLKDAGIWAAGGEAVPGSASVAPEVLQAMVERLAELKVLSVRERALRRCPRCRTPRTPETIGYRETHGEMLAVRFRLREEGETPTSLLVWTDAAWKLLGTPALLVHPDLTYALVRYRRKGVEEKIVLAKSALPKLASWLPGGEVELLEERPGASWLGTAYDHPLALTYPALSRLPPPAGTVFASPEVSEMGTGIVAMVPAHGGADMVVSRTLKVEGWPVVRDDGRIDATLCHNYAGLPLADAEAFVLRDLADAGALFAEVQVRRGVPHCLLCGESLFWGLGKVWALDPDRLTSETLALFSTLLAGEPIFVPSEAVPWPVTETSPAPDGTGVTLLECTGCDRLAPPSASSSCECGKPRTPVARQLLPAFANALSAWGHSYPFPNGCTVLLYLPKHRRSPSLLHQLAAMEAARAQPAAVRLTLLPTLPKEGLPEARDSFDATRAAILRWGRMGIGRGLLPDRRRQEARRLRRVWELTRTTIEAMTRDGFQPDNGPAATHLGELLEEDQAILSVFERLRQESRRLYEIGEAAAAHALLARFLEVDLLGGYMSIVRSRLALTGLPPSKSAVYRVLGHLLPLWAQLYAPVAPFTMEAIHRSLVGDGTSLFERALPPVQQTIVDPALESAYATWLSVVETLGRARRRFGVGAQLPLSDVVLILRDEESAKQLDARRAVLSRLANVTGFSILAPGVPWSGLRVEVRPVTAEINRAFPSMAGRVTRVLTNLTGERVRAALSSGELTIVVEGKTLKIDPSMVDLSETLPEGFVPFPWEFGQMLLRLPESSTAANSAAIPALSRDAYELIRRVEERLSKLPREAGLNELVLEASGALREELARQSGALARYLNLPAVSAVAASQPKPIGASMTGRTVKGERWVAYFSGVRPVARTRKAHLRRADRGLAPASASPTGKELIPDVDAELAEREEKIRAVIEELDQALGRPLMGPAKMSHAWDAGYRTAEAITGASAGELARVPGFGRHVAEAVAGRQKASASPESTGVESRPATEPGDEAPPGAPIAPSEESPASTPAVIPATDELTENSATANTSVIREDERADVAVPSPPSSETIAEAQVAAPTPPADSPSPRGDEMVSPPLSPEPLLEPPPGADLSPGPLSADAAPQLPLPPAEVAATPPPGEIPPEPANPSPEPVPAGEGGDPDLLSSSNAAVDDNPAPESESMAIGAPVSLDAVGTETSAAGAEPVAERAEAVSTAEPQTQTGAADGASPPASGVEIWPGTSTDAAWRCFLDCTVDTPGTAFTREFPDRLREEVGSRDVTVVWLSHAGQADSIAPGDLPALRERLIRSLSRGPLASVYIDALEFLVSVHGGEKSFALISDVDQEARVHGALVIVPANPELLSASDLEQLTSRFRAVGATAP